MGEKKELKKILLEKHNILSAQFNIINWTIIFIIIGFIAFFITKYINNLILGYY